MLSFGQALASTTATFICRVPSGSFALALSTGGTAVAIGTGTAVTFSNGAIIGANSTVSFGGFPGSAGASLYGAVLSGSGNISYFLSTTQ